MENWTIPDICPELSGQTEGSVPIRGGKKGEFRDWTSVNQARFDWDTSI